MTIIYFGESKQSSTSFHRASALRRLGHEVTVFNPYEAVAKQLAHPILGKIHFRTGYRFLRNAVNTWLGSKLADVRQADLVWVNGGELFGPQGLQLIRSAGKPVVLYNNDDPTGGRDGRRFDSLLKAVRYYDLCAVMRDVNVKEYKDLGAPKVKRVIMSYDDVLHQPFGDTNEIPEKFRSDVAFVGTWMRHEKRDEFLLELINAGISVSIWGNRWQKSPHWSKLQPFYKGAALAGRDYVAAIQGAKISLGMLSKGNRDLYTRRSVEIPFSGGLLCAERTTEHQKMYREDVEAVFWDNAAECIQQCRSLLADDQRRNLIRDAGRSRVLALGAGNEAVCNTILKAV
ncbi:MAG: glycosyltransferase family 1 protein [Chitinophagaceae bacterium]|nr:MAG: glycosyltransferase family 1 protein [Chitinophagaceae bacterium]